MRTAGRKFCGVRRTTGSTGSPLGAADEEQAGVMTPQGYEETKLGTSQGNPSLLLSDIMLSELDKELERMRYENITKATLLKRSNRFIAEVDISGHKEIVHVKNTGRCKELLVPGCEVWLTAPGTPKRKTKYDLVAVRKGNGILFNIDSQAPNKVVMEWLARRDYSKVIPEYTFGESRIDFYMERDAEGTELERYLMEVKGCTLEIDGIGYFPDAPTKRGVKHIHELIRAKESGYHAALAFVIQMDGIDEVMPNIEMHPEFGVAMDEARASGVEIKFLPCHVEPDELVIEEREILAGEKEQRVKYESDSRQCEEDSACDHRGHGHPAHHGSH